MNEQKQRKTDRRTLYTRMVVKEALMELLSEMDYADITVATLCRKAEINRGTFYLHYGNLSQVMDELFADALGSIHSMLFQIGCATAAEEKCAYPLCRFLRENKKYQPLFFSDTLHSQVIEKIASVNRNDFIAKLKKQTNLDEEALTALFLFQLNGCLAISKKNVHIADESWAHIQCSIDRFLKSGIQGLEEPV